MKNIAIIGARYNSKGVPNKNVKEIMGHPLISYSIGAALLSKRIDHVIFTSDSPEYIKIAEKYGRNKLITILRPPYLSEDETPDHPYILHALYHMSGLSLDDNVVLLRPTTPFRQASVIDKAIETLCMTGTDSLRSVVQSDFVAEKLYRTNDDGHIETCLGNTIDESNLPRGYFKSCFMSDGYVDVIKVKTLINKGFYGKTVLPFFIEEKTIDIDTPEDFNRASSVDTANEYKELFKYLESCK